MGQPAPGGAFDISILELKPEDELDLSIYTPACLAKTSDRDSFDNQPAIVAGWGDLKEDGNPPDPYEPRDVELMVRPVSVCPGLKNDGTEVSPSDICAAAPGKDSCQVSLIYIILNALAGIIVRPHSNGNGVYRQGLEKGQAPRGAM